MRDGQIKAGRLQEALKHRSQWENFFLLCCSIPGIKQIEKSCPDLKFEVSDVFTKSSLFGSAYHKDPCCVRAI